MEKEHRERKNDGEEEEEDVAALATWQRQRE